jgi:hypothetical protein
MYQAALFAMTCLLTCRVILGALSDPLQDQERTCFQTGQPYHDNIDLRSDVAIVYGIDRNLPQRLATWRDRGYRVQVMTGASWGNYQDYLYGRFDGTNHEDEAQTERSGKKISHGGDVYYMCPGPNYGKFLCQGVQRALDAGATAIHLEEPEFWVRGGYSDGFKREWKSYYGEDWRAPDSSVDAQWRASKLKYFLYRRALQQVFEYVQSNNVAHGRSVRCYVPTHSLLNYAHWRIVSPESSLARLDGCDGYIAQVWTGTARTPNLYRAQLRERTFATAFLEYGAMQNLVRATGRRVWYLADPVEDNPNHDWGDYRRNWEATLTASLLQPEVWRYEVMPWPERVWRGRYPSAADRQVRQTIPPEYAQELQTVISTLNDMRQAKVLWDCGTPGVGVLVSDSLMFERGEPAASDAHLSQVYGLALPLLNRGIPVQPVQLESVPIRDYLKPFDLLFLSYQGMKPLSPEPHAALADWVKAGGVLVVWDDDADPYNRVREWWNTAPLSYPTPRVHLFEQMGLDPKVGPGRYPVGKGVLEFYSGNPAALAKEKEGDVILLKAVRKAAEGARVRWKETNHLLLRRGPYLIGAGLEEAPNPGAARIDGQFIDLFNPDLPLLNSVALEPGARRLLLDLSRVQSPAPQVLASACKVYSAKSDRNEYRCTIEGIADTPGLLLLGGSQAPRSIELDGQRLAAQRSDPSNGLLWIAFRNEARPRELVVRFE